MNAVDVARSIGKVIRGRRAPNCPAVPEHGPMYAWTGVGGADYYCGHWAHTDVRKAPATRCFFTDAEAQAGQVRS